MVNRLRFDLQRKPHPYPEDKGASFEKWGKISILILLNERKTSLLETEWNLVPLADWFMKNQDALRHEHLSIEDPLSSFNKAWSSLPEESLAQAVSRLKSREFTDDQEEAEHHWFTNLFEFRERHCLSFALSGSQIPEIIIGCNHGTGEISISSDKGEWVYFFDMDDFCNDLQKKIQVLKLANR